MSAFSSPGQTYFSLMSHRLYDWALYRWISTYIWHCPTDRLMENYADHISDQHLEVGVGTGYFLQSTLCADHSGELTLMDLNAACLRKAGRRLAEYSPSLIQQDIRQPLVPTAQFKSIAVNYVLHCVPGSFRSNIRIFEHLHEGLKEGGVLFGATLIDLGCDNSWLATGLMRMLNKLGIFQNSTDQIAQLKAALEAVFARVEIQLVGNAAVFQAWR